MSIKRSNGSGFSNGGNDTQRTQTAEVCPSRAPFGESQTSGAADADRDPRGRFVNGNRAAFQHGARSKAVLSGLTEGAEASQALSVHRREIEADLGDGTSRVKRDLVARYVECCAMANFLGQDVAARGVLTARGRSRAALSAYLQVLDRQHRLGASIGLERREKPVSLLAELINAGDAS